MLAPQWISGFRQSGDRSWRVRAHRGESAPAGVSHRSALRCGFVGVALCRLLVVGRGVSHVTFPRLRRRTLIFMTALAVISALVAALRIGYHFGRRAGSTPSPCS
jgi:hypothetical protein